MDFDQVLPIVGEFGRYQKLILWFVLLPAVFPCGFSAYNQLFMTNVPDHWCKLPDINGIENQLIKDISIPIETRTGKEQYSQCFMYDNLNYSLIFATNFNNNTEYNLTKCKNGWRYSTDNIQRSVITEWDLVCSKRIIPTIALVLFGFSGLIGNYIFGYIQDRLGRKPAYFIYLLVQCVFGIGTIFVENYYFWIAFRMGVGFTVPAILGTPYVLAIELVGPKDRATVMILINIAYSLSLVALAIVVWAIRDWRQLALATTAPFTLLFLTWFLLPESPRWLMARGKYKETEKILKTMAKINKTSNSETEISNLFENMLKGKTAENDDTNDNYGIKHLFQLPNLRWKTIIITFLWFTNISVYVGLSYYAPALGGDEYLNFFLAGAVEFPTYLFLWPAIERLGRRWTLCTSMIIGGASCLATYFVQNDYVVTLALYCIGKMGISSSFVVLPLMASELYPTVVRGLGMSMSSGIGMLGPIFIPLINYLGSTILTLPLILMGIMLVSGGVCSLLLPETLNQPLPQTIADAEQSQLDFFVCCVPPQKDIDFNNNNNNHYDNKCYYSDMDL